MNFDIELSFKKLLGKGRAWRTPTSKMSDFLDVLISPLSEVFKYFKNLKFVHFPLNYTNKNNIVNSEEFFAIKEQNNISLEERALNIVGQWSSLSGSKTFEQLENILRSKGIKVRVIENIPDTYNKYGARYIGNGFLQVKTQKIDPIAIKNHKHAIIIQAEDFLSEDIIQNLIETIVKSKPFHNTACYIPRFLRKKEIHHKLTKLQMQTFKKCQYCDCRSPGNF